MVKFDIDKLNEILNSLKKIPNIKEVRELRKRLVLDQGHMAKMTYDRIISELVTSRSIRIDKKGNRKYYSINKDFEIKPQDLEHEIKIDIYIIKQDITILENMFDTFNSLNKSAQAFFIIKKIFHTVTKLTTLCSLYPQNKDEYNKKIERLEKYINRIFKTVKNDKDAKIVYPLIVNNLYPKKLEFSMNLKLDKAS